MSGDQEDQDNELLALQEICSSEELRLFCRTPKSEENEIELKFICDQQFFAKFANSESSGVEVGGVLRVSPDLCEASVEIVFDDKQFNVNHLPPIGMEFVIPKNYPSESRPCYQLSCEWLTGDQIRRVSEKLEEIWTDGANSVVLYMWMSFLKEDLLSFLKIKAKMDITELLPKPENHRDTESKTPLSCENKGKKKVKSKKYPAIEPNQFPDSMFGKEYEGCVNTWLNRNGGFGFLDCDELKVEVYFKKANILKDQDHDHDTVRVSDLVKFILEKHKTTGRPMAVKLKFLGRQSLPELQEQPELEPAQKSHVNDVVIQQEPDLVVRLKEYNESEITKAFQGMIFDCAICFTEKLGQDCFRFVQCDHIFCNVCMKSHFEVQIDEGQMNNLICPEDKCNSQALPKQIESLVSERHFKMYDKVLLATTLETMADVILCPLQHCQCPTMIDREARMGQCPKCNFAFCIYCKATYHGVAPCRIKNEERKAIIMEYLTADEAKKQFMEKRFGKRKIQLFIEEMESQQYLTDETKPCPKCQAPIQKSEGCNKMTCNKCQTNFCYLCGKKLHPQNPYSHFNDPSQECYMKLFEGAEDDFDDDDIDLLDGEDELDPQWNRVQQALFF